MELNRDVYRITFIWRWLRKHVNRILFYPLAALRLTPHHHNAPQHHTPKPQTRTRELTRFLLLLVCFARPVPSSSDFLLLAPALAFPGESSPGCSAELSPYMAEPGLICGRDCGVSYETLAESLKAPTGAVR